jgi:hypothetical protein
MLAVDYGKHYSLDSTPEPSLGTFTCHFLRDLLADKPAEGADAIQSRSDWSDGFVLDAGNGGNAQNKKT